MGSEKRGGADPTERFQHELSRTLRLANEYLMQQVERSGLVGLAPSHGDILSELFVRDEMRMSELSQRIGRDPSTVTALVKKLVAKGLARTAKDPLDRRATNVALTEQGHRLKGDFERISVRLNAVWHDGVEEADLAAVQRVIRTVQANLEEAIRQGREEDGTDGGF